MRDLWIRTLPRKNVTWKIEAVWEETHRLPVRP
jgi:hypothetical protein